MTPVRQQHLVEVHPEVSFTVLAGSPMKHRKATLEGRAERLSALRKAFGGVDAHAGVHIPFTAPHDIRDVYVAADSRGLRMEMIA